MSIEINEKHGGRELIIRAVGKVTRDEYRFMAPELERRIRQHGKIRVLFDMTNFTGWDAGAMWEDIKFDAKHFSDIERLAMVGEKKWHESMAIFCKPMTTATVKYFDHTGASEAERWLEEGVVA